MRYISYFVLLSYSLASMYVQCNQSFKEYLKLIAIYKQEKHIPNNLKNPLLCTNLHHIAKLDRHIETHIKVWREKLRLETAIDILSTQPNLSLEFSLPDKTKHIVYDLLKNNPANIPKLKKYLLTLSHSPEESCYLEESTFSIKDPLLQEVTEVFENALYYLKIKEHISSGGEKTPHNIDNLCIIDMLNYLHKKSLRSELPAEKE